MRSVGAWIVCATVLMQACTTKDYTFLDVTLVALSPSTPAIPIGATQPFTASATLADGSTQDVSHGVAWSSSNPSVATIDGSGMATALAAGTTTIQARLGNVTGTTELTVRSLVGLTSIAVAPATPPNLPVGENQQFTATGRYDDGSSVDLTRSATWSSSNPAVASVDAGGLARGLAQGTTTIQASIGGVNGSAPLSVVSLASIAVTPANPTIGIGGTQQFTATGRYSDGTTARNLTASVTWSSDTPTVATIGPSGLATAVGQGFTTIHARVGTIEGTTRLTVRVLTSITVMPANPTIGVGGSQQFSATGTFSDGSQQPNLPVTWSSDSTAVATIDSTTGLATGAGPGMATIHARSAGVDGSTVLSVRGLTSITVNPTSASIFVSDTQQFQAIGHFSVGPDQDISDSVTWISDSTSVATITGLGLARGVGAGTTTIRARSGAVEGTASVSVTGPTSITVAPSTASIPLGGTQQFTATGTFPGGGTRDLTQFVTWTSTFTTIATVNPTGRATGLAYGGTTIQATLQSVVGSAGLTVGLVSIAVTPPNPSIALSGTQRFTATGTFANSGLGDVTPFVAWGSTVPAVATIDSTGLATGRAYGGTTIQATSGVVTGSTGLTVGLVSLSIGPAYPAIPIVGGTQPFTATGTFADSQMRTVTPYVGWSSSFPAIATIDTAGVATGRSNGGTRIQAASGAISSASTGLTVGLVSIAITPLTASVRVGFTQQFTATGTFTSPPTQPIITNFVLWSSTVPTVATINPSSGVATGVAVGATMIGAQSGNIAQTTRATLTVTP